MPSTPKPVKLQLTPSCLDSPTLARLQELDPNAENKLIERVVAAYMKALDKLLPELEASRGSHLNLNVVRHVSHTLKSSSASLGALGLAERCAEIETLARIGQTGDLEVLLDGMLLEVTQVRKALLSLLPHIP